MVLGGFGAPLFLFLAGVAIVLSAESKYRRTADFAGSWRAAQKRGWQSSRLAFLFRLQSYVLSGGLQPGQPAESRHPQRHGTGDRADGHDRQPVEIRPDAGRGSLLPVAAGIAMLTPIVRTTAFWNCCRIRSNGISGPSRAGPTSRSSHGPDSCLRGPASETALDRVTRTEATPRSQSASGGGRLADRPGRLCGVLPAISMPGPSSGRARPRSSFSAWACSSLYCPLALPLGAPAMAA